MLILSAMFRDLSAVAAAAATAAAAQFNQGVT